MSNLHYQHQQFLPLNFHLRLIQCFTAASPMSSTMQQNVTYAIVPFQPNWDDIDDTPDIDLMKSVSNFEEKEMTQLQPGNVQKV